MNYIDAAIVKYADLIDWESLESVRSDAATLLHDDALSKKVLPKIGGKRPGKKCKGSYISADKKCGDHAAKTASGKRKLSESGKLSGRELADKIRARKGFDPKSAVTAKRLGALDDRIEKAQKANTAKKSATTKARNAGATLTPQNTNLLDPKQSTAFFNQGAAIAKAEGRATDQKKWEKEAKKASSTAMKVAQQKVAITQPDLFGIEETSSLPLFAKRDSGTLHIDVGQGYKRLKNGHGQPCDKKRGWEGLKGACKRAKKGASADDRATLAKQSKVDLAGKIKARKLAAAALPADNVLPFKRKAQDIALDRVKSKTSLAELDPSTIEVDPKRFQYKIVGEHTASGEVGSLSGVRKYDPNLSGILQVWKDPVDNKTYVVNGHNRLALAKRLGADAVAVRYLDAPDAKTARSIGALTNIAEGRGDALDAAKFFRDTGISKQDLDAKGIPMREKIATDGMALSKLDDSLFRKTIDGDLSIARAAIIGGSGLEPSQQRDLSKLIDTEGKRRNLTDGAIQEMVDIAKSSNTYQEQTMSLFGAEEVSKSNMIEKAKLQAAIKKRLSREKNLFGAVSRGTAAKDLARGGNQINAEQSGAISNQAQQALNVFDQMKNLAGPISQAINAAADRVAAGENPRIVEKNLYESILESEFIGGSKIKAA